MSKIDEEYDQNDELMFDDDYLRCDAVVFCSH